MGKDDLVLKAVLELTNKVGELTGTQKTMCKKIDDWQVNRDAACAKIGTDVETLKGERSFSKGQMATISLVMVGVYQLIILAIHKIRMGVSL